MLIKDNFYFDFKNIKLYGKTCYDNELDNKEIFLICHGMAEHIDRYDEFFEKLAAKGYLVFGYNHRGHKFTSSKEDYGYIGKGNCFNLLVNDLNSVIDYLKEKYNKKIILFGHSMGSFVSLRFMILYKNKVSKLILSGSGYNDNNILRFGIFLSRLIKGIRGSKFKSKLIDKIVFGSYNKKIAHQITDKDWLNTQQNEVQKYIEDEYCGGIFTISYFLYFFKGLIKINNNYNKIDNIPILLISGKEDPVGNYGKGVLKLAEKLRANHNLIDVSLFDYLRHEIIFEIDKDFIIKTIIEFAEKQI